MYEYKCKLVKVVDGDTIDVDIDLGFGVWLQNQRIRMYGIDTPESRTSDSIEKVFNVIDGTDHAGNTLTFKTASGTGILLCEGNCYVLYSDGTNIEKANEYRKWRTVTAAETVQAGAKLFVDTNSGAVTITLPASPAIGDEVHFADSRFTFDSNALTVGRNSSKIVNASSDLVVNTEGASFGLVFSGSNIGWTFTEK